MIAGTLLAWVTTMLGLGGVMKPSEVGLALQQFGIRPPIPGAEVFLGRGNIGLLLVTAIPLGVYNLTGGMNNVESASAAGDNYSLRHILLADGIGIDRDFNRAALYAAVGAVLSFFGFIHGAKLGFAESWQVAPGLLDHGRHLLRPGDARSPGRRGGRRRATRRAGDGRGVSWGE